MIAFVLWLAVGALVGWIASLLMRTNQEQGTLLNITVGIVGALVGGFLMRAFGRPSATINEVFSLSSFLVSLLGACVLLAVINLFRRGALR